MATPDRIPVGYVRRAHGLRGDVLIRPMSDDPARFAVGAGFLSDEIPRRPLDIAAIRAHTEGLLVKFTQIGDRSAAESLRGVTLTIGADERRSLDVDEYWPEDLQGVTAYSTSGVILGEVAAVVTGGAQDRLVVKTSDGKHVEIPFVAALVPDVDVAGSRITLDPPPGLFD